MRHQWNGGTRTYWPPPVPDVGTSLRPTGGAGVLAVHSVPLATAARRATAATAQPEARGTAGDGAAMRPAHPDRLPALRARPRSGR